MVLGVILLEEVIQGNNRVEVMVGVLNGVSPNSSVIEKLVIIRVDGLKFEKLGTLYYWST